MKNAGALWWVPPMAILPLLIALGAVTALSPRTAVADDLMHVNGNVSVADGQHAGNVASVNGSVNVGANAVIGSAHTVNGAIRLGHDSQAGSAETVNGGIHIGQHSSVKGEVRAVNGELDLENGAIVDGSLVNVNGSIHLSGAHVGGRIKTVSGDIELGAGTEVDGDLIVERTSNLQIITHMPRIVIGPGSVVKGVLHFERPVKLYVSDRAQIGTIEGATPLRFSGDAPP